MVAPRPVDGLGLEAVAGFALSRLDAIASNRCARCGRHVCVVDIHEAADAREYAISALCPACWAAITTDEEATGA